MRFQEAQAFALPEILQRANKFLTKQIDHVLLILYGTFFLFSAYKILDK